MSEDIDNFIQHQKQKLAAERENLNTEASPRENGVTNNRQTWDKEAIKQTTPTPRMRPVTPEHTGLPIGGYEEKRRKLQQERQKEYNDMISRDYKYTCSNSTDAATSLQFDSRSNLQRNLKQERQMDYLNFLQNKEASEKKRLSWELSPEQTSLRIDSGSQRRKQLMSERAQEYKQLQAQKQNDRGAYESSQIGSFPFGHYELVRDSLEEERKREYQQFQKQTPKKNTALLPYISPDHTNLKFGSDKSRQKCVQEEQKNDYTKYVDERNQQEEPMLKSLPITGNAYQRYQKCLGSERKREYQEFLQKDPNPEKWDSCRSPEHIGLDVGGYEQRRKQLEEQYQKQYQDYLNQKAENAKETPEKDILPDDYGLPVGAHQEARKIYDKERRTDYQEYLQKKNFEETEEKKESATKPNHLSLPVSDSSYLRHRGLAQANKQKEYNDYLQQQEKKKQHDSNSYGLPINGHAYQKYRACLKQQRNKDYNEFLRKNPCMPTRPYPHHGKFFSDYTYTDRYRKQMQIRLQKQREYYKYQRKKCAPISQQHQNKKVPKKRALPPLSNPCHKMRAQAQEEKRQDCDQFVNNEMNKFSNWKWDNEKKESIHNCSPCFAQSQPSSSWVRTHNKYDSYCSPYDQYKYEYLSPRRLSPIVHQRSGYGCDIGSPWWVEDSDAENEYIQELLSRYSRT